MTLYKRESTEDTTPIIVGIGASAGGLEALESFFTAVPEKSGCAFVVVQHLSPSFESHMDEVLRRRTLLPVQVAQHGEQVKVDNIYLIPPGKDLVLKGGKLWLKEKDDSVAVAVNIFFESLALDQGENSVAVVLSGSGSDGALGIKAVKEAGGLIICQQPASARFASMPEAAIATELADLVIRPEEMGDVLRRYAADKSALADLQDELHPQQPQEGELGELFRLLQQRFATDFRGYKNETVSRRIQRRMGFLALDKLGSYLELLREDNTELTRLYRDLLIGVTEFFRDPDQFEFLKSKIFPEIVRKADEQDEIRVWVAGCATGEEAYSIAILLQEVVEEAHSESSFKIFASDLHEGALAEAGRGQYGKSQLRNVNRERLDRFFDPVGDSYRIVPELRKSVVFVRHNLLSDVPFTRLDFASCRNLLIYLQPTVQQKALSHLHFGLRQGGYLFLGSCESPGAITEEFIAVRRGTKIFKKRRDRTLSQPLPAKVSPLRFAVNSAERSARGRLQPLTQRELTPIYETLLQQFIPAAFLVDRNFTLLHSFGGAEEYLTVPAGPATQSLLDLIVSDLRTPILSTVRHAFREREGIRYSQIPVRTLSGKTLHCSVITESIKDLHYEEYLLVRIEAEDSPNEIGGVKEYHRDPSSQGFMNDLQEELRHTKDNLQNTIEELEASNEELQATNEELLASNEELQSTNEELHSVNEELNTVNGEHQRKIQELCALTDDMNRLLSGIQIGVIFVDTRGAIRRFTRGILSVFELEPTDTGRSIFSFSHSLKGYELRDDLQQVIESRNLVEREVKSVDDHHYLLRILPYEEGDSIDGAIITLVSITHLKRQAEYISQLGALVESSSDAIVGLDLTGAVLHWSKGAQQLFCCRSDEVIGRQFQQLFVPDEELECFQSRFDGLLDSHSTVAANEISPRRKRNGEIVHVSSSISPVVNVAGETVGFSLIERDMSELLKAEARQRLLINELSHRVRNTLTLVQTIARSTTRRADSVEEFEKGFLQRLDALGTSHSLLTRSGWKGTSLRDLLDKIAEPYRVQERIRLSSPVVEISAEATQSLAMFFHELLSNSVKHGALAYDKGHVHVEITPCKNGLEEDLLIRWSEVDGPPVEKPERKGFGSALIEQSVPYELGGFARLNLPKEGVECELQFPMKGNVRILSGENRDAGR